tara:strand:+ start:67 stop:399 length:333 start_codon:yes stop_codon:yes gene_type:complete
MRNLKIQYDNFILLAFVWIFSVSMIDHYYTIKLEETILIEEKNPIGMALIEADQGSVALFMTTKMVFLWLIAIIILAVYQYKRWMAWASVVSLAITQTILILYFIKDPVG